RAGDGDGHLQHARGARLLHGGVAALLRGPPERRRRQAHHRLAHDTVLAQHEGSRSGDGDRRQRHVPLPNAGNAMKKTTKGKPERRIPRTLSRRAMLRGALGVGVALPWLEVMRPRGLRAQTVAPPKRFGIMFSPCGTIPENWVSTINNRD